MIKESKTGLAAHDDKWVGHNQKPTSARFRRSEMQKLYDGVVEEFSVPELRAMLRKTWEVAEEKKDGKGMLRVIELVMHYAVGKPVQRSITVGVDSEMLLRFINGENGLVEEEVVDVEPT